MSYVFSQQSPSEQRKATRSGVDRWLIYIIPLVSIVTLGSLSLFNLSRTWSFQESLVSSQDTLATLKDLSALINEAETGQRGYLLTGEYSYKEPYDRARFQIPGKLDLLRQQVRGKKFETVDLTNRLIEQTKSKLVEMKETLDVMEAEGKDSAMLRLNRDDGQKLMSEITETLDQLELLRASRLQAQQLEAAAAYFWAIFTATLAFLLTLASVAWGLIRVDKELMWRNQAELKTSQRMRQLRVMTDIVSRITSARDVYSVFGIALNEYRQLIGVREAAVRIGRGKALRYEGSQPSSAKPRTDDRFHRAIFKICDAIPCEDSAFFRSAKQLSKIPEVTNLPEWKTYGKQIDGLLTTPMIASSRGKLGRIILIGKFDSEFDDGDLSISLQLAHAVAVAVENARLTEAANVAAQRKDEFLAMLGHELRNPLAGILTGSDTLSLPDLTDDEYEDIRAMIRRQAGAMNDIVNDLLDVSRIARGKISLAPTNFELGDAVSKIVQDFAGTQSDRKIQLNVDRNFDYPVKADLTRIGQCLTNLLHNACKFSPAHTKIEVHVQRAEDNPELAEVSVVDHGVGLDSRGVDEIFDLFHQVGTTIDRTAGGLGLGLPLARGIMEMHGGTLVAMSDGPGEGSTFRLQLPLTESPIQTVASANSDDAASQPSLKILAIDDRADARLPIKVLLSKEGHQVLEAESAQSGLDIACEEQPDIIICDIGLPGELNGYDVAKEIRRQPQLASVYLVALSGYSQDSDRRQAAAAGFDYHVAKPIAHQTLHTLLKTRPRFSFPTEAPEIETADP